MPLYYWHIIGACKRHALCGNTSSIQRAQRRSHRGSRPLLITVIGGQLKNVALHRTWHRSTALSPGIVPLSSSTTTSNQSDESPGCTEHGSPAPAPGFSFYLVFCLIGIITSKPVCSHILKRYTNLMKNRRQYPR